MPQERQPKRKRAIYLAGHRAGWEVGLRFAGLDPDKFKYTPPPDKEGTHDGEDCTTQH